MALAAKDHESRPQRKPRARLPAPRKRKRRPLAAPQDHRLPILLWFGKYRGERER